ncbi:hypothetical protein ACWEKM_10295 [Streptomyces sp. NPDC004752]
MKSQDTPFEGGPMDGRVLPVLLGPTGHPPKTYRIPVPDAHGGPPTVLVYRRMPRTHGAGAPAPGRGRVWGRLGLTQGWMYLFDAEGGKGAKDGAGSRWPWSRRAAGADATPPGRPDDADG